MMVLTAARPKGRQAAVLLTYEKTDISEEIAPDLESFKYTDVAESKSDSVSITVNAKAAKWKMTGCRKGREALPGYCCKGLEYRGH